MLTPPKVARGLHSYARTVVSCMMRTRNGPRPTHSDTQASQSRVCREREPTRRVVFVIVSERGEKTREGRAKGKREEREREKERKREKEREKERKREREKERKREREKGRENERRENPSPPPPSLPSSPCVGSKVSVWTFKTHPCVPAKRAHVLNTCAFCRYTRRRLTSRHPSCVLCS